MEWKFLRTFSFPFFLNIFFSLLIYIENKNKNNAMILVFQPSAALSWLGIINRYFQVSSEMAEHVQVRVTAGLSEVLSTLDQLFIKYISALLFYSASPGP